MSDKFLLAIKHIQLETKNLDLIKTCQQLSDALKHNTILLEVAIRKLSEFLLNFEDAVLFRNYLSNILLALVTITIPLKPVFSNKQYDLCTDLEKTKHLEHSVVLGLLSDHPDIKQYALKYFQINPIPPYDVFIHHEDAYNVAPKKRRLLDCRQKITDYHMVSCCHSLLTKLPKQLSAKWDWSSFVVNFSQHENTEIRWMVKECIAILTNMTEAQSKLLSKNLKIADISPNIPHNTHYKFNNGVDDDLNPQIANVVNIEGIMLPIYDESNVQSGNLVPVKSTMNNLRSLALAVASGNSLSLMGPVGSGKTSLVEHLAAITGRKGVAFKKVQLGDQTDSRMLLGSHQCTDIPGEFIWAPGVLTEAVRNGHWLLLEDIDCAALDVASTLSSLLERKTLCVPGYRDALAVTPGFQLFVTQRTVVTNYGFQKKLSNSSTLLQKHLTQINVEPLSRSEMAEIIQIKYPSLTTISPRMIEVFMMFSVGSHDTSLQNLDSSDKDTNLIVKRGSRLISTRDLMKWCARSVIGFNVTSPESALKVLQDAFDIFTSSISSMEDRLDLAKKVGTCLGIVETKTEFYFKHYKPNVSLNPSGLEVGRASIPRLYKRLERIDFENKDVVFSFTRQSAGLLEKIACCVSASEPVLLVGETGTGKTSSVQYLAKQTGHKLVVINMNQQSDSADFLGGYKPVHLKYIIQPIKNDFIDMFKSFYNVEKNQKFLGHIETCYDTENWTALLALMKQSHKSAVNRLKNEKQQEKLKTWMSFGYKLLKLDQQVKAELKLTFAFIEGSLIKAMQEGYWVLLDEINLASAEVLECLAGLLEDKDETIELLEKGDKVPIKRHPDFTLFACMNPATDVGKKDLPVGLRNRFTEFFVDELTERNDLMLLIGDYLSHMNLSGAVLEAIYNFYSSIKKEAKLNLVDGAGSAPHYSLRTLCRALMAAAKAKCGTISRSLYEAFCLSFLTQLDRMSHPKVEAMIAKAVIGKKNINSVLKQIIPEPKSLDQNYLLFEGHWIPKGKLDINIPDDYILTQTVRKNLRDIARIVSLSRLPILLQGDTSVGKTSLITYMAKASGNYCVRINNHEHTDLQEYIGSYATDSSGSLVFKEGVLVEAMRRGYWIILDELNLAPSDVLEALNRVLDDNRELYIPETQETVKADPNFMLFATQNPPGLYGGRKMLSRAFRNRFVELHFDEIPRKELETILHQRCHIPASYSKKMIEVMAELQVRRRGSAAVQGKDGFITLRDLFRWGQRYKLASNTLTEEKFYDWDQHIADEGYLILAGKVRQADERKIIVEVIEKHIKRKVIPENLFSLHQNTSPVTKSILELILNNQLAEFSHVVWTYNMRRLAVLIAKAFSFDEPVLLVGETGCGKTTICQVLAKLSHRELLSLNCHMHTDSSDFLGGLRPVRQYKNDGRLFEWVDGPLIKAMEKGHLFLADEISLADDSVLERMNSLLEPERQLVLSERSSEDSKDVLVITANKNFHFIGTMNPGGDFGKKELSPALRNRFTEIWCDHVSSRQDLVKVLEKSVIKGISLGNQEDGSSGIGNSILDFTDWLKNSEVTSKFPFSIRDLLSWVEFVNITVTKGLLDVPEAYIQGACMTFLDCFGTTLTGHIDSQTLILLRRNAIDYLFDQIKNVGNENTEYLRDMLCNKQLRLKTDVSPTKFGIKPFYIDVGPYNNDEEKNFSFTAPTTGSNTLRLLRGLQLNKAILLEGNPGVGKTSLVTALAKSSGHRVIRINLSDQTDITDLFGTDLPTEDGSFAFKEGAFLNALQNGDWILLDELNLAPQPVLEGLNACLDHRGEIFIPELGKTFKVKQQTKLFACQNPLKQGGARRGLPISFLNRFTQVYIDTLTKDDLMYIVEAHYNQIPTDILHKIVEFNCRVSKEITELQYWGHKGGPWEMNLRDIQRWCEAMIKDKEAGNVPSPGKYLDMLYVNRMRTEEDKEKMIWTYNQVFGPDYPRSDENPQFIINDDEIIFGDVKIHRNSERIFSNKCAIESGLLLLRNQMSTLKSIAQNVKMNWLSILVGPTATGKSSVVQVIADLTGNDLHIIPVTSAMDVSDLLGGFEQVDFNRNLENLYDKIEIITIETTRKMWLTEAPNKWKSNRLLSNIYQYRNIEINDKDNNEIGKYRTRLNYLIKHCEKLLEMNDLYDYRIEDTKSITSRLRHLNEKISKLSSMNAGGKFEWIDSLLVKTMEEGSWLLLDNVNLTSAAVLDRLNGLLEPNGVLSIPERGDISEIKPHPNFRIFFTMDPKYGEISRAMRNRGVEIYILRPEDTDLGLSETMEYFDLIALLSSCGLPNQYHDICIRCHESMTAFIQGPERPTISHLLQAAYLTYQQLVRGISSKTALLNSFSDVYIKPRSGSDFTSNINKSLAEMKNDMLKELQNELEEDYNDNEDVTGHTLTVQGLSINSEYETARQVAYPIVKLYTDVSTIDKAVHSVFNLIIAFKKCPPNCIETLYYILKQDTGTDKGFLHDLIENTLAHINNEPDYVSYQRYLPETFKLNNNSIAKSNINLALLYNKLLKKLLQNSIPTNSFSAIDYSNAVTSGKITDDFVEYPILKYCQTYLQVIDNYIVNAIKDSENHFNDNVLGHIVQLLNWRSRFIKICSQPIFISSKNKRTPILKEDIVPLLQVHSKWIQKYLMEQLFKLQPNKKMQEAFQHEINKMNINMDQSNTLLIKVTKKLRKLYGQPKLYRNQNEFETCNLRRSVHKNTHFDINHPIDKQIYKVSVDPISFCTGELAYDVPDEKNINTLNSNVIEVIEKFKDNSKLHTEIQLLPINLYVMKRIIQLIQPQLIDIVSKLKNNGIKANNAWCEVLVNLVNFGKESKGFPPTLLSQLEIIEKIINSHDSLLIQKASSLPAVFWDEFYRLLESSPDLYPLSFFNVNNLVTCDDGLEPIPANNKRVSSNLPLMSYYIDKMITFLEEEKSSRIQLAYNKVALRDRVEYSTQLRAIQNVLWRNIASLDVAAAYKLKSDATFELQKYEQLLRYLYVCVSTQSEIGTDDLPDKVLKELRRYFDEDSVVLELVTKANAKYENLVNKLKHIHEPIAKLKIKILTAQLSLLTSVILVRIMAEINPIDHVEKYRLKIEYIEEDIKMFNVLLSTYYVYGIVSGTVSEQRNIENSLQVSTDYYKEGAENRKRLIKVHPHCPIVMERINETAQKVHKYASGNTFRPKDISYGTFVKDCRHFTNSVLSNKTLTTMISNLVSTCEQLYTDINSKTAQKSTYHALTIIKESVSWLHSVRAFYTKIDTAYSEAFPDLAKPLQSSLSQIIYSVANITDVMRELIAKIEQGPQLQEVAVNLLVYPNSMRIEEKYLNRFVTTNFMQLLNRNVIGGNEDMFKAELECLEVLKMNLTELSMVCYARERADATCVRAAATTLSALVRAWEKQRQDIERQKQDEEALYVTKSKCEDEDDEKIAYDEIMEMFPSYSEEDFSDFKPPSLEQTVVKKPVEKGKYLISSEDVTLIYKWHSNFVKNLTNADWLSSPKRLIGNDVKTPLLLRYPTFSRIMQDAWDATDAEFEGVVSPALLVLLSHVKASIDGETSLSKGDFYRSAWVSETRECLPLLQKVKDSTNELLDQWPDFPTLKDIIVIVDRILSFPITSPVSRFLTGLELLRDKMEEWNKNAHKGNNMIDISLEVGQQIVNWRKLEMTHWKECLNSLYQRKQAEAHKYWFYMFGVVNSYLEGTGEAVSSTRVISVLKDFMETSNVAEFEVRLDIVYVYHCHLVHLEPGTKRDELISILWNIHNYYAQFLPQITAYIKEKRAPIEKKLRDFVKICTWDRDLSYWSVKNTVDKVYKALHKHTKEFEKILKEGVGAQLVAPGGGAEHAGLWDRPRRAAAAGGAYHIDALLHLAQARTLKKYLDVADQPCAMVADGSLLSKVPALLNKARALCKDTITNTGYPSLVQTLDDFVTLVIETTTHLGSLEVDTTAVKDKQTSQAKNIVQQKRKALADLFKYLAKMGLNYRTGLVILSAEDELYDFTIPPVDLVAAIGFLKTRRCDASMTQLWSGCERYYQLNVARHRGFTTALASPHKDLGLQNIERCKGFAAQLMKLTNVQKKSISKYSRYLCDLRSVVTNITNALDLDSSNVNICAVKEKLYVLADCYAQASILLDQLTVVLKALPEKTLSITCEPQFDAVLSNSPIVECFKNSDEWQELYSQIKAIISIIDKQKTVLNKLINSVPNQIGKVIETPIVSQNYLDVTNEAASKLKIVIDKSENILKAYEFKLKTDICDIAPQHPILRSINNLVHHLNTTIKEIEKLDEPLDETMEDEQRTSIVNQTEDLVASMLLIIQSVYKKHLPVEKSADNMDVLNAIDEIIDGVKEKEESKEILEDKHLKELLQDKLSSDSKMLQLDSLINKIQNLLVNYVQFIATRTDVEEVRNVVMRLVPILEQTVLFVQYFISQKVAVHRVSCKMMSVLLKIFSDLAANGFCKPSDLDMEEGEGEGGPGKLSGGTGLGDGEGQKDVSDRIENQDQLDDAQRPGEEKEKQEDRDCKEEEKGVNMTDDFDSHLQDVERKEGDDSDQDNNEEDADKQMGETDNAAEKLDQQIWGSEDEEDIDEEQSKKEKEERGAGESTGEKEMAAKEQEKGTDDGEDGKDKKKKKDINEMEEPEVDDDQIDPYHGKHQQLPEPEDFELPDDMNVDGEEGDDDKDGETETENPFDIDVMKQNIPEEGEEQTEEKEKDNKNGLEVSSDEEDGGQDKEHQHNENAESQDGPEEEKSKEDENTEDAEMEDDTQPDESRKDDTQPDEQPNEEDSKDEENLPKNDEGINQEDKVEEKNEPNPQANPSNDDPTAEDQAENAEMEKGTNDNVQTNAEQAKDEEAAPFEQTQEQVGEDKQSTGRSEMDKSDRGHRGDKQAARAENMQEKLKRFENRPGRTDQERTLGDINEKKHKKAHSMDKQDEGADDGGERDEAAEADAYQHVKDASKDDVQMVDAATKEQADQQPTLQQEDEEGEELKDDEQVAMDVDEDIQVEKAEELKPEKMKDGKENDEDKSGKNKDGGDEATGETGIEVEGDAVVTERVPRGRDTTYHTRLEESKEYVEELSLEQYIAARNAISSVGVRVGGAEAASAWRGAWRSSGPAARALCERLRLVLEPTSRSRMAGDFRTGRAINMRRVIPYIASHFRKDRIWLRRTKPAKREYKIAIAVDDSCSMADNKSKELAFESLALVSQALNLLESGDLAVLSFGEKPNVLHPFTEQFSEHSGSKILEQLRFEQTKTKIAQLLDFCTVMFDQQSSRSDALNAKLLVVVSDGRGIFSEGETRVLQAVRRARQQGIFIVYVVIDNPDNKDSIMDIRRPIMDPVTNTLSGFVPYLDTFPFPFYLILRDVCALPAVLGDALRQWFELAANTTA